MTKLHLGKFSKMIAAAVAALGVAVADSVIDFNDVAQILIAIGVAAGVVYAAPANATDEAD